MAIEGVAMEGLRAKTLMIAMKAYVESNGKMQLTRIATPAFMRQAATEFTGKTYPRSRKGLLQAYRDLVLVVEGKSLAEIGQVAVVNRLVGTATAPEPRN